MSSIDLVIADRVSAIPEKNCFIISHTQTEPLVTPYDPSQTLVARKLEPSHSCTLIDHECVGAHDANTRKIFQEISKAVGKQLTSICCNNVMIKAL